ncbi:ribonuclease T1 [Epithele typhae]|uniref:ribonuclease T1 n=1 Tax=Epithele typhae TaxID=378194 RepID=UPI002007F76C|nr:ribonuclease T1 [Epithele typhae]KAH9944182.1 ribonuclease T1 [Epithele typhae]
MKAFSIILAVMSAFLVAATTARVSRRQSGGCDCAGTSYSSQDISEAIEEAEDGGASDYPHQYHDYEGFSFPSCSGKFFEYPLEQDNVYTGGSPGADRVIYDEDSNFCACLTHTGASNDDFLECDF